MRRFKLVMAASSIAIAAVALSRCLRAILIDVSGAWTDLITWAEGDRYAGLTTPISLFLVQTLSRACFLLACLFPSPRVDIAKAYFVFRVE